MGIFTDIVKEGEKAYDEAKGQTQKAIDKVKPELESASKKLFGEVLGGGEKRRDPNAPLTTQELQTLLYELERERYESGKPFTEAALDVLPLIREDVIGAKPGESPLYQAALQRGLRDIQQNLAKYGLQDSSAGGQAVGEYVSGLRMSELGDIRNRRMQLAGFGGLAAPPAFGGTLQAAGLVQQQNQFETGLAFQKSLANRQLIGEAGGLAVGGLTAAVLLSGKGEE